MIDYLNEVTETPVPQPVISSLMRPNFDWLDYELKKGKKGGKRKKKGKTRSKKHEYAKLAFQYGMLASRYDTLARMVELAVAAKRQQLGDNLLDEGLEALGRPRVISLPEL